MYRSLLLSLLALTLLCQGQTAVADAMLAVRDANPALMRKPTVHLKLGKVTSLPGHAELAVELRSYTVESIEASPDDPESSPAGSGDR